MYIYIYILEKKEKSKMLYQACVVVPSLLFHSTPTNQQLAWQSAPFNIRGEKNPTIQAYQSCQKKENNISI
jgi:hypothetical protein